MKNNLFILGVVMLFLLVGCGNNVSDLDINKTQDIIEESLKNMEVVDDDSLVDVYNLNLYLMEEHVIKQNEDGDLYAIIKTSDKVTVKNNMLDYFEKVEEFNKNYSPERLEILNNRVEKEIGNYLIYIVAEDADNIYNNIVNEL